MPERDASAEDQRQLPAPAKPKAAQLPARASGKTAPSPRRDKPGELPPWRVILHNDPVNAMDVVVEAIVAITPLTRSEALRCMWRAHTKGRSLVLSTHRERAELYREQFKRRKLTVTIEPGE